VKSASALSQIAVRRVAGGAVTEDSPDVLAVEEPLEIRLGLADGTHRAVSITMRTPGDDAQLAAGFLFTEGILTSPDQIKQIRHCGLKIGKATTTLDRAAALNSNTIRVDLNDDIDIDFKRLERHFYTSSSCGVCGKSSIDALRNSGARKLNDLDNPKIDAALINALPERLRASQDVFDQTGGLHASALFTIDGEIDIVREDVGRHNALDKVIGAKFLENKLPLFDKVLLVSGRASFELVQKALMAGIPIMVAVGAPSSLAVELADEFGMTLVGFVRDGSFNVYTAGLRIS
jgi:FdhD protein